MADADNETEILEPVDYPPTPYAWTQVEDEEWRIPTQRWHQPRRYLIKFGIPAVVGAGIAALVLLGGNQTKPAPPTAVAPKPTVVPWEPDASRDDTYIKALQDSGRIIADVPKNLRAAHWSCTYLSQGHGFYDLVSYWDQQPLPGETPRETHANDEEWVGIVVKTLCPQFR